MNRLVTGIVVLTLLVATGFALADLVTGARKQFRDIRANDTQPYGVRYGGGAAGLDVDHRFILATLAFIHGDDTYAIATGPRVHASNPYTLHFMVTYFVGRLQPARYVVSDEANWILCYGCDPGKFPKFESAWDADNVYYILRRRT